MLRSSPFHLRKNKRSPDDCCERKLAGRFCDVPYMKLTDILKSLRRRRLRRNFSRRSSLTHSRSLPPPIAGHHGPLARPPSPDRSTSPSFRVSCYRSDPVNISGTTEEECPSGMSTSSLGLESIFPDGETGCHFPRCVPSFPTSPSEFQLRFASTKDCLVERLEQRLRRLSLGDASLNPQPEDSLRDILMGVCLESPNVPPQRTIEPAASLRRPVSHRVVQQQTSLPHDQNGNVVPMILLTSVDAKHAKPLPPSVERPSRTPFGPSNCINDPTNVPSVKSVQKTMHDDPFTTQARDSAYSPDDTLTFRLPSFPPILAQYAPETPTPMYCDHFGDCRGDLWEILHPPLVAGTFTLPPFKLPPLNAGLFDDMSTPLPY